MYSRIEAPLGTVRERDAGTADGQRVRMVKIRMDGPTGLRWIPFARWWWERNRGPVPRGQRVCHADGDLLNDDPANFVLLTPGEVFNLYHRLHPAMSRSNHAACGRSAAARNVETGRRRRASEWLPCSWYAVDLESRVIHNAPRRKRWSVYHDHGIEQRLGRRLASEIAAAKSGDPAAAAFALRVAPTLERHWRWVRSAALGWPGMPCLSACILFVLMRSLQQGGAMWTCDVLDAVTELRRLAGWHPARPTPQTLSSCVSPMRDWVQSRREGPRMTMWWITPAGVAARVAGPAIVAVRGRDLNHPRFKDFTRKDG